jgi:hypothetical protein
VNYGARLLHPAKENPHARPDGSRAARASPTGYKAYDRAPASAGLRPEESLRVGNGFNHTLAMKIEHSHGDSVRPVEHHHILGRVEDFVQIGSER